MKFKYRWWGKGDIDASIGIFFDGFSKILSATGIMLFVFGMRRTSCWGRLCQAWAWLFLRATCVFYEAWPWLKKSSARCDRPALWHWGLSADGLAVPYHGACLLADWRRGAGLPGGPGVLSDWRHDRGAGRLYRPLDCEGGAPQRLMGNMASSALVCSLLWASHGVRQAHLRPAAFLHGHHRLSGQGGPAVPEIPTGVIAWCWALSSPGAPAA